MNNKIIELLAEFETNAKEFEEEVEAPASGEQLAALRAESEEKLGYIPSQHYLDLLAKHDGLDGNGTQLYGTSARVEEGDWMRRGLVEANVEWRRYDPNHQFVFFAESGDKLYCFNFESQRYEIVDRVTKTKIYEPASFATFDELADVMLNHMLDRFPGADE